MRGHKLPNCKYPGESYTIYCNVVTVHCMGLLEHPEHLRPGGGEGVLPYMGYIGMCRCEGYGFQVVYSRIGYINQSVWV